MFVASNTDHIRFSYSCTNKQEGIHVRAAWYDHQGNASDVLRISDQPQPRVGAGEVLVRVHLSGINPGDTKKRSGWLGSTMPYPLVIPHSDAAGVIETVGQDVDSALVGQRVWVFGAQSYRPFGTAAEYVVVPQALAVALPDNVSDETGASLGIPGITAHRAVFSGAPVAGKVVVVQGVLGAVSSIAAQLAHWKGATVVGTVRHSTDLPKVNTRFVDHAVALDDNPRTAIQAVAPGGVDRIIEVALSDNADLDSAITKNNAVIATYFSHADRVNLPFSPFLFNNVTLRFLGSDDFTPEAKLEAARDLTAAARDGVLQIPVAEILPLSDIATAHDLVDQGSRGRILLRIND